MSIQPKNDPASGENRGWSKFMIDYSFLVYLLFCGVLFLIPYGMEITNEIRFEGKIIEVDPVRKIVNILISSYERPSDQLYLSNLKPGEVRCLVNDTLYAKINMERSSDKLANYSRLELSTFSDRDFGFVKTNATISVVVIIKQSLYEKILP